MSEGMTVSRVNMHARPPVNMYPHLSFETYRFIQFPEWVMPAGAVAGKDGVFRDAAGARVEAVLCRDEEEKQNVLRGEATVGTPREADEKTSLYALAAEKGIEIDRRWGLDTLRRKVTGMAEAA